MNHFILTFGIHLITIVGQDIHDGAAIQGPKEPFSALVWTHFESFVRGAVVSNSANFPTCILVHVSSANTLLLQGIPRWWLSTR